MQDLIEKIFGATLSPAIFYTIMFLLFVVAIYILVRIARSVMSGTYVAGGKGRNVRLAVMDATPVDSQRRLVLVRRDDVEHLILIGGPTDVVVEQNIRLSPNRAEQTATMPQDNQSTLRQTAAQGMMAAKPVVPAPPAARAPIAPVAARAEAPASSWYSSTAVKPAVAPVVSAPRPLPEAPRAEVPPMRSALVPVVKQLDELSLEGELDGILHNLKIDGAQKS